MGHIIVDENQARIISESPDRIEIRDQHGNHLGFVVRGVSGEDLAAAMSRKISDEPRYTTDEVLRHLQSLGQK